MTIIEQIKAEIERRIKILREDEVVRQNCSTDFLEGKIYGYEEILSFLSTFETEKPMNQDGLEEEIEKIWKTCEPVDEGMGVETANIHIEQFDYLARHFAQWGKETRNMKDCTTCKYGYEDERLGIPMCHHPKRFSEDCVDFNMHEEKEIKESEKLMQKGLDVTDFCKPIDPSIAQCIADHSWEMLGEDEKPIIPNDLEEAANHHICKTVDAVKRRGWELETQDITDAFIAGAKWQEEQDKETIELAEDHAYLAGAVNEREKMMKDAVEAIISQCPGSNEIIFHNPNSVHSWEFPWKFSAKGLNKGDKVRVIVLPKEDEK